MRRGVTLIEMLIVLIILAIILGMTITLLQGAGRDLGVQASADAVSGLLRQASTHARIESTPLWVVVDAEDRSVQAVTREVLGNWHFETRPDTQDLGTGWTSDGGIQTPGRLGMGVYLNGASTITFGSVGPVDPASGFFYELWIRRSRRGPDRQTVVLIGEKDALEINPLGVPTVELGGGRAVGSAPIPPDVWTHVMVVYDPAGELRLYVDRRLSSATPCRVTLTPTMVVTIGAKKSGLAGDVDEFVIGQMVARDRVTIGSETRITRPDGSAISPSPLRVYFGPDGRLDPGAHDAPVRLSIRSATETRPVTVLMNGTVVREDAPNN